MDHRQLFLRTLQDLENKSKSSDLYDVLGLSGLIRKMFLEQHCLVDHVNQQYQEKLKFEVTDSMAPDPREFPPGSNSFWAEQDGVDPETSPPGLICRKVSRKEFFQRVVIVTPDRSHTLKEVVRYVAHVCGGVHVQSPHDEKEAALQRVDTMYSLGGGPMATRQLLAVTRVILKGLAPLQAAIKSDLQRG